LAESLSPGNPSLTLRVFAESVDLRETTRPRYRCNSELPPEIQIPSEVTSLRAAVEQADARGKRRRMLLKRWSQQIAEQPDEQFPWLTPRHALRSEKD
jgi:hypothetical protein